MMLAGPYDGYMKTRLDGLSHRNGGILDVLEFVRKGGAAEYGEDITYVANVDIEQLFIFADALTINAAVTLTMLQLRPLLIVADTVTINGTLEGSGKGCNPNGGGVGKRYDGVDYPWFVTEKEAIENARNYCLCGSGGGAFANMTGGGAFKAGGAVGTNGGDCDLTATQLRQILLSPFYNMYQAGFGGSGGSRGIPSLGGIGGGRLHIITNTLTISATGNILVNGLAGTYDDSTHIGGGGGGGFLGMLADIYSIHGSATVTANGGSGGSGAAGTGGAGAIAQIEV